MILDNLELGSDYRYRSGIEDMRVPHVGTQPAKAKEAYNISDQLHGESQKRWVKKFWNC
jgi:hypothetical protein